MRAICPLGPTVSGSARPPRGPRRGAGSGQLLLEELDRASPGELRGLLVVTRGRVVVEPVVDVRVDVGLVLLVRRLQRLLEGGPPLVDPGVQPGVVDEQ